MDARSRAEARQDIEEFKWSAAIVLAGDVEYIDRVIDGYAKGGAVPRNEVRLNEILEVGARKGHIRSTLAKAAYLQDVDPSTAAELYSSAARADNCYAQAMLASSYSAGVFTGVNEAKAYYWWSLATRDRRAKGSGWMSMPPYLAARLVDAYGGIAAIYEIPFQGGVPRLP